VLPSTKQNKSAGAKSQDSKLIQPMSLLNFDSMYEVDQYKYQAEDTESGGQKEF
jgi:hypothetical protein